MGAQAKRGGSGVFPLAADTPTLPEHRLSGFRRCAVTPACTNSIPSSARKRGTSGREVPEVPLPAVRSASSQQEPGVLSGCPAHTGRERLRFDPALLPGCVSAQTSARESARCAFTVTPSSDSSGGGSSYSDCGRQLDPRGGGGVQRLRRDRPSLVETLAAGERGRTKKPYPPTRSL